MIVDTDRFIAREKPHWEALAKKLDDLDYGVAGARSTTSLLETHRLYRRAASALVRLESAAASPATIQHLQQLVARAYAEVHAGRKRQPWRAFLQWIAFGFPQAFRRQISAFVASLWITLAGVVVGCVLMAADTANRELLLPFSHLHGSPSERVAEEETKAGDSNGAQHATFAASLMQNNISVTIRAMAFGITYGIGTAILLFYNGVILGAVSLDYIMDGQLVFLLGWLLPHGAIELPAIFLGGQAGLVLARALIGRGTDDGMRVRMRKVAPDLASIIMGAALLLVWAGIVESYFSQHHEPAIPYAVKIAFGVVELIALAMWLAWAGRKPKTTEA